MEKVVEKKLTKREKFELAKKLLADNAEMVEFFNHEIELLDNKKSNGNKKANVKLVHEVELVYKALASMNRSATASEIIADNDLNELENEGGTVSPQKVSALLKKLVESDRVDKYMDKKKTYFRIKEKSNE